MPMVFRADLTALPRSDGSRIMSCITDIIWCLCIFVRMDGRIGGGEAGGGVCLKRVSALCMRKRTRERPDLHKNKKKMSIYQKKLRIL